MRARRAVQVECTVWARGIVTCVADGRARRTSLHIASVPEVWRTQERVFLTVSQRDVRSRRRKKSGTKVLERPPTPTHERTPRIPRH